MNDYRQLTDEPEGKLRVWNIINIPGKPSYYDVETPREGAELINQMARDQLKMNWITSNVFGMDVVEPTGEGDQMEWCEWYGELPNGDYDDVGAYADWLWDQEDAAQQPA